MDIKLQTKICDNFSLSGFFVFFQKIFNCEFMSRKKLEYMFMAYLFVCLKISDGRFVGNKNYQKKSLFG